MIQKVWRNVVSDVLWHDISWNYLKTQNLSYQGTEWPFQLKLLIVKKSKTGSRLFLTLGKVLTNNRSWSCLDCSVLPQTECSSYIKLFASRFEGALHLLFLGTDGETEMQKAKVGSIPEMGDSGGVRISSHLLMHTAESSNSIPTPGHLHKTWLILQAIFHLKTPRLQSPPKSKIFFPNLVSVCSEVFKLCKNKKPQQSVGMWRRLKDVVPVHWAELRALDLVTPDVTSSLLALWTVISSQTWLKKKCSVSQISSCTFKMIMSWHFNCWKEPVFTTSHEKDQKAKMHNKVKPWYETDELI